MRLADTILLAFAACLPATTAQDVVCQGANADPSDIAACANELTARGSELCTVVGGFTETFCQIGTARIVGVGRSSPSGIEVSSPCVDIAIAVGKILDKCTVEVRPYGLKAAGALAANNNGNIIVHALYNQ